MISNISPSTIKIVDLPGMTNTMLERIIVWHSVPIDRKEIDLSHRASKNNKPEGRLKQATCDIKLVWSRSFYRLYVNLESILIDRRNKQTCRSFSSHSSIHWISRSTDSNDGTSPALDHRKNEWSLDSSLTSNQPTDSNAPHSSISWKQMREEEQRNSAMKSKLPSDSSPLNLYKRFQQKSSTLQRDNHLSRLSNDERIMSQSVLSSQRHQAIQTSILFDSPPSISQQHRTTDTTDNHLLPPRASSANHKSLPDLSFISQYSKELPRSRTTSPLPSSTLPPPITVQPAKQEPERPRTLKSIKRYKNSKHSTEPLGVFYSPQLRKTFAAVPSSAVIQRSDITPAMIEMRLPVASPQLNSSRKLGTRANSCDIQATLQECKAPISTCHPTIALNDEMISEKDLSVLVHCHDEKRKERKGAYRYGGMRRCQSKLTQSRSGSFDLFDQRREI